MSRSDARLPRYPLLEHRQCFVANLNFDVVNTVLRYVDARTLKALCQVSRLTYTWAIHSLYRDVRITSWNACLLLRTLIEVPMHGELIKHAIIVISEPHTWAPVLPVQAEAPSLTHTLVGSNKRNHRARIGSVISRLPALSSLEVQYCSCRFGISNSFGCSGRTARCGSRPVREILSCGFRGNSFGNLQRLTVQHCSLSQLHAVLTLPSLHHFKATITEGTVSDLTLPRCASRIRKMEINIRDYLSSTVPAIVRSCEALRSIRLVVTGFPAATDLNARSFFEAAASHQHSLREVSYYNLHEAHEHSEQGNILQAVSRLERLTRLSTSILPFASQGCIWTKLPRALRDITLFDSKGYCADILAPRGSLDTLAADSSLLPDLVRLEMKTLLYPGDGGFVHHQELEENAVRLKLQSRGISLEHVDWQDRFFK